MLVANDDEGWWCAKESEQLNVMTDIAKLSRGVERAAWGRGAKSEAFKYGYKNHKLVKPSL
jgi:hypothetical protein